MHRYTRSEVVGYQRLEDWLGLNEERIVSMRIGSAGGGVDGVLQLEIEKLPSCVDNGKIKKIDGVCGGAACIGETRVPVWLLIQLDRLGMGEEAILVNYPNLQKSDLVAAREYYETHVNEIEGTICSQDRA